MPWEPLYLRYDLESLWRMLEQSLDQRVQSPRGLWATFRGGGGLRAVFRGGVGWGVRVEGVCSSIGDCWKRLGIGSTSKCLWNSEAVGVWRMLEVSEVGVGKTLRCFQSGKQVIPWQSIHWWLEFWHSLQSVLLLTWFATSWIMFHTVFCSKHGWEAHNLLESVQRFSVALKVND